nr:TPA_asm: hypothetical protein HUJ06_019629 [Nelumbo nucifera]
MELADSIRNHHCCSPEVLADQLQEALHDLNNAIKSHPRLFIASKHKRFSQKSFKDYGIPLSSVKTGSSALPDWRTKQVTDHSEESESKSLGRTLSKIDITSLEFSEALPFAAFASLLVEIVARLDLVIEEVEELGRKASFRELKPGEEQITVTREKLQPGKAVELQTHLCAEGTV